MRLDADGLKTMPAGQARRWEKIINEEIYFFDFSSYYLRL